MLTAVHTPGPKVYEGLRDQRVYAVGDWTPGGGLREGDSRCLRDVGARDRALGARCQGDGGRGGHQCSQSRCRARIQCFDDETKLRQCSMIEVVQFGQDEVGAAQREGQLKEFDKQTRVLEVDPDVAVADIDAVHSCSAVA